jgi:carbamoyl-phosphate synthase small subunit
VAHAILALEDGTIFHGEGIGHRGHTCGELVFNTAMTGYQEIITDPSYAEQIVTLTYPHIGNVGINIQDNESEQAYVKGLVIRSLSLVTSNWRAEQSLSDYLQSQGVVAIAEIDTRHLTHILREKGAQRACISTDLTIDQALAKARATPSLKGMDLAKVVTCPMSYDWKEDVWQSPDTKAKPVAARYKVVVVDYGVKRNILRLLVAQGAKVVVVPATSTAEQILSHRPDGVVLSNGPGDPEPCDYAIACIKTLLERDVPIFGICLGHQLLGLAMGAKTYKMKFGHHGANHPVLDIRTGRVWISAQNHGFAIDEHSLPATVEVTHTSLFDGSIQGIRAKHKRAFSFQGHPEASPGPHDVVSLFADFEKDMQAYQTLRAEKSHA